MKNEFSNRLLEYKTSLGILNNPLRKAIWFQQNPVAFTAKVANAVTAVGNLEQFCQKQGILSTGATFAKSAEEKLLGNLAHSLARAMVTWFTDQNDLVNADKVDFVPSDWLRFKDEELLVKARLVRDLANEILAGPKAAQAATYDITAASVKEVDDEITNYDGLVSAPQQAISDRAALTAQLRARFGAVDDLFAQLDDMILRFNKTQDGCDMIAAYQAARIVRDYGVGHNAQPPAPAPTTGTTATPAPSATPKP